MPKSLTRLAFGLIRLVAAGAITTGSTLAAGISIDAGLTPAENRWILRSQMRVMERKNDPGSANREMTMHIFPLVVAYGLRSDATVMVRQALVRREMTMGGTTSLKTGLADLLVMAKFRLIRVNKPGYTIGVAPTLGLEVPSGQEEFTSNTWDLNMGCFVSGRIRSLGADLDARYSWAGMAKTGDTTRDPGDDISAEGALAYQIPVGPNADYAVAPVVECSYRKTSPDREDGVEIAGTGESVLLLSPGVKVTRGSLVLEGLIQYPVWQDQVGVQTKRGVGFLIGFRLMN
jgi:hypothetical protein